MKNIKESILLKFLCYVFIPIMIFILAISIVDVSITSQYGQMDGPEEYIETEEFGREYLISLIYKIEDISKDKRKTKVNVGNTTVSEKANDNIYDNYSEIEDESYEYPVYYEVSNYTYSRVSTFIKYIIIDKENGNMFTNIKSNNY